MKLRAIGGITIFCAAVLAGGVAHAATGDVTYSECLSAEATATGCTQLPNANANGENTGLDGPESTAASADGQSVYVAAEEDDAVATFNRDRATGALTFAGCITGDTDVNGCTEVPSATSGGSLSGFDVLDTVVVSGDGRSVYAVGDGDDSVLTFDRDPGSGALTYAGCLTGNTTLAACAPIAGGTATGGDSGLDSPSALALAPDGGSLYAAATGDAAVARFDRDSASGELTFAGCIAGQQNVGDCTDTANATATGADSGLDDVNGVAVSPGGDSLYATGSDDAAMISFDRDAAGALSLIGCLSGDNDIPGCAAIPGANATGSDTGMDDLNSVAVSPDGNSVHATGFLDAAIVSFTRDQASGVLAFANCITGEQATAACDQVPAATATGADSGLDNPIGIAVAPDGLSTHAAANGDAALVSLARDPATGALTHAGCISGEQESASCVQIPSATAGGVDSGLDSPRAATLTPDGRSVLVPSATDTAIGVFNREGLTCGGASQATAVGSAGADLLAGTDLDDVLVAGDGADTITAAAGNDLVCADAGDDSLAAGEGDDVAFGGEGADALGGDAGADQLLGEGGDDALEGGPDGDAAEGGAGSDVLKGDDGGDILKGDGGADRLKGGAGKDTLDGDAGKDKVTGGAGKDAVKGDKGKDTLKGNAGKDKLKGGKGKDVLKGGPGKDVCNGGPGKDRANRSCEQTRSVP